MIHNLQKYKVPIIIINLILLLAYYNYSIYQKEKLLNEGELLLLRLAPVDPRSLMQGDYMVLNYEIAQNIPQLQRPQQEMDKRGYVVVTLDRHHVAHRVRVQNEAQPLNKAEYLIKYTALQRGNMRIGAESYFFQEGHAERYEQAKYGGLKVDAKGNSVLVGLYNEQLIKIE